MIKTDALRMHIKENGRQSTSLLILVLFIFGLSIRFVGIGQTPFSESEAELAGIAMRISRFDAPGQAGVPAYLGLTALAFFLFDVSEFWARFWPVLVGSSLILLPVLGVKERPVFVSLAYAAALAVDPILIASSRIADGNIFAVAGLVWGLVLVKHHKYYLAGIALGIGIMGGAWFWIGLCLVLIAIAVAVHFWGLDFHRDVFRESKESVHRILVGLSATLLLVSSAFLLYPQGIGNIGAGLVNIFVRANDLVEKPYYVQIIKWFAYSYLPLLLGFGLITKKNLDKPEQKGLLLFTVLSVVFSCIFKSSRAVGQALSLIPLWFIAISHIQTRLEKETDHRNVSVFYALFTFVMLFYLGISITRLIESGIVSVNNRAAYLVILAGLVILAASYFLVRLGWSHEAAKKGLIGALIFFGILVQVHTSFAIIGNKKYQNAILMNERPVIVSDETIQNILLEFVQQGAIHNDTTSVACIDLSPLVCEWVFRDYKEVKQLGGMSETFSPDILLSRVGIEPTSVSEYRGMEIFLFSQADWENMPILKLISTIINFDLNVQDQEVYLWVKNELFTGESKNDL